MKSLRYVLPLGSLFVALLAQAQEPADSLAERLVSLRGQVDELQSELDIKREEHKNKMVYLTAQLADLEANRDRETLRISQLQKNLDEMREEIAMGGVNSDVLLPSALTQIGLLREQIDAGLPFKVSERKAELDDLQIQLESGSINAQRGINRLWAFVEDEIRLSRENAIYSQSISINGENMLVDVAKLGSVMMFFRTRNLEYGRAVYADAGWRFEMLDRGTEQEQVALLFDSLRKQIRQGYFELPVSLPSSVQGSMGAGS
jgi:hypothetical protein